MTNSELETLKHGLLCQKIQSNYPYTSSISSSAASSISSVFSADGQSSQSSAPSSGKLATLAWHREFPSEESASKAARPSVPCPYARRFGQLVPVVEPVARELRQHPRRTQCIRQVSGDPATSNIRPPSLVRQCDRKDNFVESLVDTTTEMIEVIWPLSVVPCGRDAVLGGKNLIGLRTFIQEVLKRSKTSYSTLQVALYYLVLIKPWIPKFDFTKVQPEDNHEARAMQCGRRMFLAALILASKYLQDRNYSARAWSKISGLKVAEINSNEKAFLAAVNWNLHIPESRYQRWTDVVLRFSQSPRPPPPSSRFCWKSIIPRLTPELDDEALSEFAKMSLTPKLVYPRPDKSMSPPSFIPRSSPESSPFGDQAPVTRSKPVALEPTPNTKHDSFVFPVSPRITQLPTPQMTPRNNHFCAPAAGDRRNNSSMSGAMKKVHSLEFRHCAVDVFPGSDLSQQPFPTRRPSLAPSTTSSISSPESMVSDNASVSSRSSRSSSISSTSSCSGPVSQNVCLQAQATRRSAMACLKENMPLALHSSPISWKNSFLGAQESFVRGVQDDREAAAAAALQDLKCPRLANVTTRPCPGANSHRKRERPVSGVDSEAQIQLQSLLKPCSDEDNATVLPDRNVANSFMLQDCNRLPVDILICHHARSASGSERGAKRVCGQEDICIRSRYSPSLLPGTPVY